MGADRVEKGRSSHSVTNTRSRRAKPAADPGVAYSTKIVIQAGQAEVITPEPTPRQVEGYQPTAGLVRSLVSTVRQMDSYTRAVRLGLPCELR